jgi:hypothetical protein
VLLKWAADEDIGHRGFLQLGGERLIFDSIEAASSGQVRYGDTLTDILGNKQAIDFLKFVLRSTSRGLRIGRSPSLIADQIRAELLSRFRSREQRLLELVADHASYTLEVAGWRKRWKRDSIMVCFPSPCPRPSARSQRPSASQSID